MIFKYLRKIISIILDAIIGQIALPIKSIFIYMGWIDSDAIDQENLKSVILNVGGYFR